MPLNGGRKRSVDKGGSILFVLVLFGKITEFFFQTSVKIKKLFLVTTSRVVRYFTKYLTLLSNEKCESLDV